MSLKKKIELYQEKISAEITAFFSAYSSIFSIVNVKFGILACFASFIYPNIGLCGLITLTIVLLFSKIVNFHQMALIRGALFYNALLVGLFIGYLFQINLSVFILIVFVSVFTILVTLFFDSIFRVYLIPIISIPFVVIAGCLALSVGRFTDLLDATPYFISHVNYFVRLGFPVYLVVFFKAVGTILCVPDPLVGMVLFFSLILFSPMTGLFLIFGFGVGYASESYLVLGNLNPISKYHYFNYLLTFNAIAGVFLIPSRISILLAIVGTILSSWVAISAISYWSHYNVPILSLPYNVIVLLMFQAIRSAIPQRLNFTFAGSPERALDLSRLFQSRHYSHEIGIYLPFSGAWKVLQGFNGQWTHRGLWSYALDFVKTDERAMSYRNLGYELEDYYAFNQPVISPLEGYVVIVQSDFLDQPIGQVDNQNNWGNVVVIRALGGFYILLAHLKRNSIEVKVGEYVSIGQRIGVCGNSGYSQEPHLHLHLQLFPDIGSPTIPFHLLNYHSNGELHFHGIPQLGSEIIENSLNRALDARLTFRLEESMTFEVKERGVPSYQVRLLHQLNPLTGQYFWTDGVSRLFYARQGTVFYFFELSGVSHSFLWDLYAAAPRIPISYGKNFSFEDPLPLKLSYSKFEIWKKLFVTLFSKNAPHKVGRYEMNTESLSISGEAYIQGGMQKTYFKIDPSIGFLELTVGSRKYVRLS